jgi:hypothetical protein
MTAAKIIEVLWNREPDDRLGWERPERGVVSDGLAPVADGAAFLAFDADDVAKLVLAFAVNRDSERRTRLVTETRIHCASRATRLKLTPYWLLIRPVSGLLRRRILSSVRKACEQAELLS